MFSQEGVHGVVAMPAPMAAHVVGDEKKMPDCSADVAKACLSTFIKRAIVEKSDSVDEVMGAWNGRLLGPYELASKILARWEAVRTYAMTHDSLTVLSEVERPVGRTLGKILSLKDSRESEEILHRIVGIPLEIVTQMRALYATPSPAGTTSSRKRTRGEPSMPSIRAEDPCASDAGASLGCVARCGSCEHRLGHIPQSFAPVRRDACSARTGGDRAEEGAVVQARPHHDHGADGASKSQEVPRTRRRRATCRWPREADVQ